MTIDTDAEPGWDPDYAGQIVKILFRLKPGDVIDVDAVSLEPTTGPTTGNLPTYGSGP